MADRKLGCLSIFLFVALCFSAFLNFVLVFVALSRFGEGQRDEGERAYFRETVIQRGNGKSDEKIALITMRGLISSSLPGNVGDTMVDDLRTALQQARDDRTGSRGGLGDRFAWRRGDRVRRDL